MRSGFQDVTSPDTFGRRAGFLRTSAHRDQSDRSIVITEVRDADGRRQHVIRRVNPAQAAVVRRIFTLYADGSGFTRIAKRLNAEGAAPPRHGQGWAPTAIREILHRTLYRGEVVWNRTRKRDRWGRKRELARPEGEWLRLEVPALAIVPDALWQRVQARLTRIRAAYRAFQRPPLDRPDEKYLLSGIAQCGTCGGSLVAFTRGANHRTRGRFYGCMSHHKRGPIVCPNRLLIRQDALDHVILDAIAEVLSERIIEQAVRKALQRAQEAQRAQSERPAELQGRYPRARGADWQSDASAGPDESALGVHPRRHQGPRSPPARARRRAGAHHDRGNPAGRCRARAADDPRPRGRSARAPDRDDGEAAPDPPATAGRPPALHAVRGGGWTPRVSLHGRGHL
jgi:Recombinase/Recombinase zinc beta ribbon domain